KDVQTTCDTIIKELKSKNIDTTRIYFTGFDGASVFSGQFNGVSAKFPCEDVPEVQEILLILTSLFNFINQSSIRLARFNDIQTLLKYPQLKLIQSDVKRLRRSVNILFIVLKSRSTIAVLIDAHNNILAPTDNCGHMSLVIPFLTKLIH
ncbi:unnamed protein product, partial [Rotaria sordida]